MFIIFAYNSTYPSGGMGDCFGVENNLDNAKENAPTGQYDHVEIYDVVNSDTHTWIGPHWLCE